MNVTVPSEVDELINSSGHNFHSKVARWFRDQGWAITVSPYYMDQTQQKAREVDLIAESSIDIRQRRTGNILGKVVVRLFIECKYLLSTSVFWFTNKDRAAVTSLICDGGNFSANNMYTEQHHYLKGKDRVAKLFVTAGNRGQEADPFYKALNQSLNALTSMRNQRPALAIQNGRSEKLVVLNYPVVVCSSFSQLYAADFEGTSATELVVENFLLEVQYAFLNQMQLSSQELFLIDVVEFDQLQKLIEAIEIDAETASFFAAPN